MFFGCKKGEFDRCFNRLDRPVEKSRPDRPIKSTDRCWSTRWTSLGLFKSSLSAYSLETCNEFAGTNHRIIAPGQHSSFRRNVVAEASCWQHCVRFDRPEIQISGLPFYELALYRLTNWPVHYLALHPFSLYNMWLHFLQTFLS